MKKVAKKIDVVDVVGPDIKSLDLFISQRLKVIRELRGLTQKELIYLSRLKRTQQIYSKYESGDVRIPAATLYVLAYTLEVGIDAFFPIVSANKESQDHISHLLLSKALGNLRKIESDYSEEVTAIERLLKGIDQKV